MIKKVKYITKDWKCLNMALHERSQFCVSRVSLEGLRKKTDCLQSNGALAFLWFQQKVGVCRMSQRNLRLIISTLCYHFLLVIFCLQHVQFIVIVCTVLRFKYLSLPIYKATKCKESKFKWITFFSLSFFIASVSLRPTYLKSVIIWTGYNIYNYHTSVTRKIDFAHAK